MGICSVATLVTVLLLGWSQPVSAGGPPNSGPGSAAGKAEGRRRAPRLSLERLRTALAEKDFVALVETLEAESDVRLTREAVAILVEELKSPDAVVRALSATGLGALGPRAESATGSLEKRLEDADPGVRVSAAESLWNVGARGTTALPVLLEILENDDDRVLRIRALAVLSQIKAAGAVPNLIRLLSDPSAGLRLQALRLLHSLDVASNEAVGEIARLLADSSNAVRTEALRTLDDLGPAAIAAAPQLVKLALSEHESLCLQTRTVLGRFRFKMPAAVLVFQPLLASEELPLQFLAVRTISKAIPRAPGALPALLPALREGDPAVRAAVAKEIWRGGSEAVAPLIEAMEAGDAKVQRSAIHSLGRIGSPARPAAPGLIELLESEDLQLAQAAAGSLGLIEPDPEQAVPALMRALDHADLPLRLGAVRSLGAMGADAQAAVPQLVELLRQKEQALVIAAATSLGSMRPPADEVVPLLVELLADPKTAASVAMALKQMGPPAIPALARGSRHKDPNVRSIIAQVLGGMGPAAGKVAPPLTALLDDASRRVRVASALGLALIEPENRRVVPGLIEGLGDANAALRNQAAYALSHVQPAPFEARAALVKALRDEQPRARTHALLALGNLGHEADDAVPEILRMIGEEKDLQVVLFALSALGQIEPSSERATEALLASVEHSDPRAAARALMVLGGAGLPSERIVAKVREALENDEATVRTAAARALWYLTEEPASVVPVLTAMLQHESPRVRSTAMGVLGVIGPQAKAAVPDLEAAMAEGPIDVRLSAARVVWKVTGEADRVEATLLEALEHPEAHIRRRAAVIATRIETIRRSAAGVLRAELKSDEPHRRLSAASDLWRATLDPHEVEATLSSALKNPDPLIRRRAALMASEIAPLVPLAVAPLRNALTGGNDQARLTACEALLKIEPEATEIRTTLVELLGNRDRRIRVRAASIASRVPQLTESAKPVLIAALRWRFPWMRNTAAIALGNLGPEAADAVDALTELLDDPAPFVRRAAAEALEKIRAERDDNETSDRSPGTGVGLSFGSELDPDGVEIAALDLDRKIFLATTGGGTAVTVEVRNNLRRPVGKGVGELVLETGTVASGVIVSPSHWTVPRLDPGQSARFQSWVLVEGRARAGSARVRASLASHHVSATLRIFEVVAHHVERQILDGTWVSADDEVTWAHDTQRWSVEFWPPDPPIRKIEWRVKPWRQMDDPTVAWSEPIAVGHGSEPAVGAPPTGEWAIEPLVFFGE